MMIAPFAPRCGILVALLLAIVFSAPVAAGVTVYSNLDAFQGQTVNSALELWDDVAIDGGGVLDSVTFHAFNLGSTDSGFTAFINIAFFDTLNNRPGGTSLAFLTVDMSTSSFAPGLTPAITVGGLDSLAVDLDENVRLAVGITFPSQPSWGIPLFDPPSVGSSDDSYWLGFNPSPQTVSGAVSSFGLGINVVPEPATLAAMLLATPLLLRRRR